MYGLATFFFCFFFVFVGINTFNFPSETQQLLKANIFPLVKQHLGIVISGPDATNVAKGVGVLIAILSFQIMQPMFKSAHRVAAFLLFAGYAFVWHITEKSVFDATNPKSWEKLGTLHTGGYSTEDEWKLVSTFALMAGLFGVWAGSISIFRRCALIVALGWILLMGKAALENPKAAKESITKSAFSDAYRIVHSAAVKAVPDLKPFHAAFAATQLASIAGIFLLGVSALVAVTPGSIQQVFANLLAFVLIAQWIFTDLKVPAVNIIESPPAYGDRYLIFRNLSLIGAVLINSTTIRVPTPKKAKATTKASKVKTQ